MKIYIRNIREHKGQKLIKEFYGVQSKIITSNPKAHCFQVIGPIET